MAFNILLAMAAIVLLALLLLVVVIYLRPAAFRIVRQVAIAAPASEVFPHLNDFRQWRNWSPWERLDPALARTYAGADAGEGAVYSWLGNKQVGEGRMTIVESRPNELVRVRLEFLRPFQATNETLFTLAEEQRQTVVTWAMSGRNDRFVMKAFGLLLNMDKILGGQFNEGLANLKNVVENRSADAAPAASAVNS